MEKASDYIPQWDSRGLLPPHLGGGTSADRRSPYRVSLLEMVERFGSTPARRKLMAGFLGFRAALHQAGLTQGFQWVNGSFVTDVMKRDNKEPQDIDVVTFYHLPNSHTENFFYRHSPNYFMIIKISANTMWMHISSI